MFDIFTFIGGLIVAYLGIALISAPLNIPDGGAILAICFIGARIVGILKNKDKDTWKPPFNRP